MPLTLLVVYFLFFSFLGWIIDSTTSSIVRAKFVNSGYFHALPLCPLYGFGGIVLFLFFLYTTFSPMIEIGMATLLAIAVEYIGGVFCVTFLRERLWDYSKNKLHLHGHIDAIHSLGWMVLVTIVYLFGLPYFFTLHLWLLRTLSISPWWDRALFIAFLIGGAILTSAQMQKRQRRITSARSGRRVHTQHGR